MALSSTTMRTLTLLAALCVSRAVVDAKETYWWKYPGSDCPYRVSVGSVLCVVCVCASECSDDTHLTCPPSRMSVISAQDTLWLTLRSNVPRWHHVVASIQTVF